MMENENHSIGSKSRRSFLLRLWLFLGLVALAELVWVAVTFLRPKKQMAAKAAEIITAGPVDNFQPGSVTAFPRGKFYLARLEDGGFLALSRECTHLGCTVPWVAEENRFVCPCHASIFDIRGVVVSPPAPRPLDTYPVTIENNVVMVDVREAVERKMFRQGQVTKVF